MSDKETSLAFVERMESVEIPSHSVLIERKDFLLLQNLAKTAALLEEHRLGVMPYQATNVFDPGKFWVWNVSPHGNEQIVINANLHTAVHTITNKIKEQT